ncbi:MAG: DCC1-like thiol-disulfide oxidoreductase family protein [Verrucomicrobiales bacterium]|nr:DCC1-like thiol-disulfide oxidoreductase family protein [Verrucomicrobiales bacterium]
MNTAEIFYDGSCRICTNGIARIRPWLDRRNIKPVPFSSGAEEEEMILKWHDGRVFGGADAIIFLGQLFWYSWPIATLAKAPGLHALAHTVYRWIARNRSCINGACAIEWDAPKLGASKPKTWPGWTFLTLVIVVAVGLGLLYPLPGWLWMWLIAGALWIGFKGMTFRENGGWRKISLLYFLWVGTETGPFLRKRPSPPPRETLVISPFIFLSLGLLLLALVVPRLDDPIATGWVGVAAMLCLLHFGSFAVLAFLWKRAGFPVSPIMKAPWAAKSLGEFWGPRWNRAFSDWARVHIFRPLVRLLGTSRGTLAGFLASGLAHELVISLPARGGFGLPTFYFLLQGTGLLLQRKSPALKNRITTLAIVLLPAPLLFHPLFIERVFAPMITLLPCP